jgi:hypothetical protein
MSLSWHEKDYTELVDELEDYFSTVYGHVLDKKDVHDIVGKIVNTCIDHGAIDPT